MLNRRHLRIKGLQILYAYGQAEVRDMRAFEKNLLSTVEEVYEFYIYLLMLAQELAEFEAEDVKERASKHLPSQEDLDAKAVLEDNYFIKLLNEHQEFLAQVKKFRLNWDGEDVLKRELLNKFRASEEFRSYNELEVKDEKSQQNLILFLYKKVIFKLPLLEQHLEERNINWPVDGDAVESMVVKTIKTFSENAGSDQKLMELTTNWEEDRTFIIELFQKTILNDLEYGNMISEKIQNWDMERLAMVDTILMKMAITEMIHFPSIPVKVTMNEYIDISKEFSTPNSKTFINGILDKVLVDLKKNKLINKSGRGLME